MAETALNETRQYPQLAVPLAPQPPGPRVSVAARGSGPIPAPAPQPEAQPPRMWVASRAVAGDEPAGAGTDIPMDMPTARSFLTRQSAALVSILLGSPFRPRQAAAVGHALVKADFVGADVLGRSLRVLILRLPALLAATARADGAHT